MGRLNRKKKEKIAKLSHFLAAFILLIHGYVKLEDEHLTAGLLFLVCGVIFLSVAVFHQRLHHQVRYVDAIFALLEGIAALILAADYWGNRHYLYLAYFFVAAIYLISSFVLFARGNKALHAFN